MQRVHSAFHAQRPTTTCTDTHTHALLRWPYEQKMRLRPNLSWLASVLNLEPPTNADLRAMQKASTKRFLEPRPVQACTMRLPSIGPRWWPLTMQDAQLTPHVRNHCPSRVLPRLSRMPCPQGLKRRPDGRTARSSVSSGTVWRSYGKTLRPITASQRQK